MRSLVHLPKTGFPGLASTYLLEPKFSSREFCRHAEIGLHRLPNRQQGIITGLKAKGLTRRRLLDLGFVPGSLVEAIRRSPPGDPIAFSIRGTIIALRKEEAAQIVVNPVN